MATAWEMDTNTIAEMIPFEENQVTRVGPTKKKRRRHVRPNGAIVRPDFDQISDSIHRYQDRPAAHVQHETLGLVIVAGQRFVSDKSAGCLEPVSDANRQH